MNRINIAYSLDAKDVKPEMVNRLKTISGKISLLSESRKILDSILSQSSMVYLEEMKKWMHELSVCQLEIGEVAEILAQTENEAMISVLTGDSEKETKENG